MGNVFIGRHPAALEWAQNNGLPADARIITGDATYSDVMGHHVWGIVPLHLAAGAADVRVIDFAGAPPRGREYDSYAMIAAGARWSPPYVVLCHCQACDRAYQPNCVHRCGTLPPILSEDERRWD
jgi:hypothetical protein